MTPSAAGGDLIALGDSLLLTAGAPADPNLTKDALRCYRERQAWRTGRLSIVSKSASVAARLVTVPLALRILGPERYGVWLTVGSLLTWLTVYDFGLSAGLLNTVGTALGRRDLGTVRRLISTAVIGFAALSCTLLCLVAFGSRWSGLPLLVGLPAASPLASEVRLLVLFCGTVISLSLTLNSINQVVAALQEGYLAVYAQLAATVLSCLCIVGIAILGGSLIHFAAGMTVPTLAATALLGAYTFTIRHPSLRPAPSCFSFLSFRELAACGSKIYVAQVADMAILYSANLLIANRLGPGLVPAYAVPATLFMIAGTVCWALVSPYQPAYAEAAARGDCLWIRTTALRVLVRNMAIMLAAGFAGIAFGPPVIRLWTRGQVVPGRALLTAIAIYFCASVWTATNGVLLIGLGRLKTKAAIELCIAGVHVVGAFFLLPRLGVLAFPVAGTIGYAIDAILSLPIALRHLARQRATQEVS